MSSSSPFHLGYRPSLDGLRGVAILMVLADHGGLAGDGFGFMGVNTFFVLSGFLITSLLVEEFDRTGQISFRQFYFRRALRLLPALIAMLVLFVVFSFAVDPYKRAVRELYEALTALFYYSNWAGIYHWGRHISLAHTWSLSIEEQFYIIWPAILLFALRRNSRSSLLCWIFLGTCMAVLIRIALFFCDTTNLAGNILPVNPDRLISGTDTRADSLLLGCFAGGLISSHLISEKVWRAFWLRTCAFVSLPTLLLLSTLWILAPWMVCFGWSLASALAMLLIIYLIKAPHGILHAVFENRLLVYTGQISYGLYLWHFPILKAMQQHQLPWQHMGYLILVIPVVLVSYYLIEKPCLTWKKRFQKV